VNTKTGEQKQVEMSIHVWDQWKKDNPEWIRDWSDPSTCPSAGDKENLVWQEEKEATMTNQSELV